ncbi:hypothetical protein [Lachnoclostridium sp. An14]|uniref:hypothetical protein n=1 Tax=Lachnoclostridium sp. An14 TaxID=1965562 RepID=UPI001951D458|nr:hypothetical protein [Lachnoclostridium sp. An14]
MFDDLVPVVNWIFSELSAFVSWLWSSTSWVGVTIIGLLLFRKVVDIFKKLLF